MSALVTGSSGFLGRHLCETLRKKGIEVVEAHSKNCDLTDPKALSQFDHYKFDRIYHLAVWMQAGDFCVYHPAEIWANNQKITTNTLDWWQKKQPQAKFITLGTSCCYDPNLPLTETNYLIGTPHESLFSYAIIKKALLVGLQAMHKQYGLNYLYLIPSTLYGPGYHTDDRQLHFIFDLVRKILNGKHLGDTVTLWGNGEQKRELVYIDDFIDALFHLAETQENTLINIGEGREHTIREFAQLICNEVGYPFEKIEFDTSKYVGALSKVLCVQRLKAAYPDYQQTPLKEGLAEMVDWFAKAHKLGQSASTCMSGAVTG
ncbi:MAG: NAD-dependent epimerase/dehydratase family protein [Chlamydiales bacterium]|nr:NAD-dependent epimerase/dehydratase family protein [Chlamydiales bacterium]